MSNKSTNHKVVSIKKITNFQEQITQSTLPVEEGAIRLDDKISIKQKQLNELTAKHDKLLANLKVAIEKEKAEWQETKEAERKEAQQLGYQVGYDEATEKVQEQFNEKIAKANELVAAAQADYYRTIEQHEIAIAQLSIKVAEKIIAQTINDQPETFVNLVEQAIGELKEKSDIAIYLHPNNYLFVQQQKEELEQIIDEGESLSIYMDAQLKEGACLIKYPFGQIKAGIDVQLAQIKNALEEKLAEHD